ncbi:MAG: isopenicillin N synthase family oxygenase [Xanthomonadales bacterium]|nr:isopenicillin N synthase family oxygenase [Gammaproteobacteria bacterium]MBT8053337.1 isopenicillin N synthase family oxygenase [Gammaproteobacteria bacterium]NND58049.1 isopenicillin N synthase family oxygenase [Xanthomonadales bacterium]NNK52146.1 isopenicillin N synthase family oxygenase [Xanthomonadales bacterium]
MPPQVPVLDLSRFDTDRKNLAIEAGDAYREFGFCGFVNHGLPDALIDEAYQVFRQFFALPEAVKMRYRSAAGGQRGYTPFGIEQARDQSLPDLKEFWHVGRQMEVDNPWPDILEPNRWPREIPGFEAGAYALYRALDQLGKRILRLIALAIGLDEHWFDLRVELGNSILRAIHYPPVADRETPAVRAARHEDINLITLLIGSNEEGLQILSRSGEWIPVTSIPGTIVVNIGDMMKRLTNHVLPSTPHRVINPPGRKSDQARYSIPFFMHPNPDFLIETLPLCVSEDRPNLYPQPITANDFLVERLREIKLI